MLVLRLTSPQSVHGVISDDGFTIGKVSVGGTYNLLVIGAAVGLIGAGVYRAVAPWLLGPRWLRRVTTASAAGFVVGSLLIHDDGVDFTLLKPTWLAVGLFVALPFVFGWLIGPVTERVASPGSWTAQGRWHWLLPIVLVACFPLMLPLAGVAAAVLAVSVMVRHVWPADRKIPSTVGVVVRAGWLTIAAAGVAALVTDVIAVT